MIEVTIGVATVRIWPENRFLSTDYPDGTSVAAAPNDDPHSVALARELGYKDTWEMSLDHELLHSITAVVAGLEYSPTLWGVAHGKYAQRAVYTAEEGLVLSLQRFLHDGVMRPELAGLNMARVKDRLAEIRRACEQGG